MGQQMMAIVAEGRRNRVYLHRLRARLKRPKVRFALTPGHPRLPYPTKLSVSAFSVMG